MTGDVEMVEIKGKVVAMVLAGYMVKIGMLEEFMTIAERSKLVW
jgi:hypothetical protein